MASINDYAWTELHSSGQGSHSNDSEAIRIFQIAYADLPGFLDALIGGWKRNGTIFTYQQPDRHNLFPLPCVNATYEAFGSSSFNAATGRSSWDYAKVTAT